LSDLLKKQNELKQKRDAIQKQATSEIPVQPEAAVSGEVAQGEPQTESQVTTEEGQKEVAPEAGGMVQMAEMPNEEAVSQTITEDVVPEPISTDQVTDQVADQVTDQVTDLVTPVEQPTVEEEVKNPFEQVDRGNEAKQKTIDQIEKAKRRGRALPEAVSRGIYALRKTIAYEQANDVVREAMEREIRKEYGLKEKKAPTAKKILGEAKPNKILVDEM
jgi:hypothetical protein